MLKFLMASAAIATALVLSQPAKAQSVTLNFTSDHCTGGCGPQSSFATLSITEQSGNLLFSITPLNNNLIANTGFDASFAFNLVGDPTVTFSNLTQGFTAVGTTAGDLKFDGLGLFEYGVLFNQQGGGNGFGGTLSFLLDATTDLTLASLVELSTNPPGDTPAYFGLDILSGTTGRTGAVDIITTPCPGCTPTPTAVPGPIAGAGIPGLVAAIGAGFGWYRRRRNAA